MDGAESLPAIMKLVGEGKDSLVAVTEHTGKTVLELNDILGAEYSVTSPFGFNGAFWYGRISAAF